MNIKRQISAFICVMMCLLCFVACAKSYMIEYDDDDIGLHYELPRSLEYYKYGEGYKNYRNSSKTVAVVISFFSNENLLSSGAFTVIPSLEEYINRTIDEEQLGEIEIDYSTDKNRASFDINVRESENDAGQYIYNTFIKNEKGIYLIQMLCIGTMYEDYAPQFVRWSNLIYTY